MRGEEGRGGRRREGRGGLSGNVAEEAFCLKSAPASPVRLCDVCISHEGLRQNDRHDIRSHPLATDHSSVAQIYDNAHCTRDHDFKVMKQQSGTACRSNSCLDTWRIVCLLQPLPVQVYTWT